VLTDCDDNLSDTDAVHVFPCLVALHLYNFVSKIA